MFDKIYIGNYIYRKSILINLLNFFFAPATLLRTPAMLDPDCSTGSIGAVATLGAVAVIVGAVATLRLRPLIVNLLRLLRLRMNIMLYTSVIYFL